VRRWREAATLAHLAECDALRNAIDHDRSGLPLDRTLRPAAIALRRAAEEARREAFHPLQFPEPV
jgi:hypothetical protein